MVSFAKKSNPVLNESSLNLTKYYMSFLQCVHSVKNREVHSSKKNSWNQLFSNFFRKNVEFTKSLSRIWRVNFCNFHTHTFELKISSKQLHTITTSNRLLIWRKNSVRVFLIFPHAWHSRLCRSLLVKTLFSRNFCQKSFKVKFHNFYTILKLCITHSHCWKTRNCLPHKTSNQFLE